MPTEEFRKLLDRDFARVSARELIDGAGPLLTELVNHACWAFQRCQTGSSRRENEDIAPFVLYRHIIEMVDGFHVLLNESCTMASIPLLRVAFEAKLALEYILSDKDAYSARSLAWLYVNTQRRIDEYAMYDPATHGGEAFKKQWEGDDFGEYRLPSRIMTESRQHVAGLKDVLTREEFVAVEGELKGKKGRAWYSLSGGPKNIRELAKRLKQGSIYDVLYRRWSSVIHGGELSNYMTIAESGVPVFKRVRDAGNLNMAALYAAIFMLKSTRIMVAKFRAGENLRHWYLREVRDSFRKLWPLTGDTELD
jgi:hypothetical protein